MHRHLMAALLAGVAVVGLGVHGLAAQETAPAAEPAAPAEAAPEAAAETPAVDAPPADPAAVLATVNGVDITLGHAIVMAERLPQQYLTLPDDVLMTGILEQLIDQQLLAAAESADPATDPLEVKLHIENERRGSLAQVAVQERVVEGIDAAAVQAAYDAEVAAFVPQTEYNAAHILVETEERAKELKAEIDGGADFAELAAANSGDPGSAQNGGSLGWFGAGQMVPEFEAAVASLEAGQVSDPVQTQFGWHLVKLDETRQTTPPSLDEARAGIEERLRQEKLEAELAALRAAATIVTPETPVAPAAIRQSDLIRN
jgi:peptidyl-prolyl cis-trans isomerase C